MFRLVQRVIGVFQFAFERLWHHPGLTFLALLGVVLSIGLVSNASFFAQAVDQVILNQELAAFSDMTGRPSFSTTVYTFPPAEARIGIIEAEDLANNVAATLSSEVGLPIIHFDMQVNSGNMMLQPKAGDLQYSEDQELLSGVGVAYLSDVSDEMLIVTGEPLDPEQPSEEVLDVWMHTRLAEKIGVNVGEEFDLGVNTTSPKQTIRVAGIWRAKDLQSTYWFENPDATLQSVLLVRRTDYINYIQQLQPRRSWYLCWHFILDDAVVYPDLAQEYLQGFERAAVIINKYLPEARINAPPLDPLENFVTRGDTLTILLLGFNLPSLGFLLYFLVLSSGIIAQWQQRETATLVGRGMRPSSVQMLTLFEELILFVLGYPIGIGLGMILARAMGNTSSFLSFVSRDPLPISMRGLNVPVTLVALLVTLVARMVPASLATRTTAVEVDRERARPQRAPFWYRAYFDFILVIPTYYLYRQLEQNGSISILAKTSPSDLYQDPLLILVPFIFILTVALLSLRIFPWIMRFLDFIANLIPWSTPHLALRQLGRRSHTYISPLLLVVVSLALGVYTISMAASLDQWLIDRIYYNVGTDLSFAVYPIQSTDAQPLTLVSGEWIPTPADFESLPGATEVTRVGEYNMSTNLLESGEIRGRFLAVDRLDLPAVSWFRGDFADESLGGLMNRLAQAPNAILVSEDIYERNRLLIGDELSLRVSINYEFTVNARFKVVGTFTYFPTVYEDDNITFIGNLDYLSFFVGMVVPHNLWMKYDSQLDGDTVLAPLAPRFNLDTIREKDAREILNTELAKLERVGVFGTLSIGFMAAVVMAVMGLLIYTYASLAERLHRFTILRAIGLLRQQITGQVILEYAFLTAYGSIAGAMIGITASELFVPLFRVAQQEGVTGVPLPPLIPIVAYDRVQWLVLGFVAAIVFLEIAVISRALSRRAFSSLKSAFG
ncbi:MAG: FtsX-like permease family protein [Anaerolineae bacterium]|nr:FtsX-like permease family protein [Anaerolineae bacterium]